MATATTIKSIEAFQVSWEPNEPPGRRSAIVRVTTTDGIVGHGEASPMMGGEHSLGVVRDFASSLVGVDALDHAVLYDKLLHKYVKLGPEGAVTGALAALDIALWDIKGKYFDQPIFKLLGGGWRTEIPFYASIGGNAGRTVDETVKAVEARWKSETPAAIKVRWDGDRTRQDYDVPGDIAKAKAVRKLVGDDFPLAFDANNQYSVGGAIRVGRALEELGYLWFEEPVQHYNVRAMGEVAQRLDITVSAAEQTYTTQALIDIINAGVRMVQPDIIKMGGITGLMQCAAVCYAHGVELVPHQTQPTIAHAANLHVLATIMHLTKPAEFADPSTRMHGAFANPPKPSNGKFEVPSGPGLGLVIHDAELDKRRS
ncbi:mandelate racemase/muconate lactonizing enzyme family protein [Neorhizobium galegae]|uniref:Mandelate racemase/muconate lactonizing protein n=1 Tax=Neorhizobium galegae bv. orientalis str. HAMBI 540 TaxID=1028800 RepID=A0A068T1V5_NEOGA|nr:mandelate racemase/muconate lactonizing enzyme family protein [Neorhizobium galegae]MCQ1853334.1 mandelate racemase/muconate lactonizing enzyme family protein [Neorhizobium galegae]CDN52036.1 Mandelate racemase/muconate lactonizing protein [Neorhizobium galegae bv. orientalis str. HAMBI 540]CDZ53206.1 Mandelate racemase/muconate lactonizing protein [Neorhizobium galegae bv. orientalis]